MGISQLPLQRTHGCPDAFGSAGFPLGIDAAVGRGDDLPHAAGRRGCGHPAGGVGAVGAVVHAGQNMAVQINHRAASQHFKRFPYHPILRSFQHTISAARFQPKTEKTSVFFTKILKKKKTKQWK